MRGICNSFSIPFLLRPREQRGAWSVNIKCEPRLARSMPGLHATQRHLHQGAGAVDFVHGGEGQDLAWGFGVEQDGLLADGQGADEVFGDLDQEVFEGVDGVFVV
ncbi:hypothetical protein WR25_18257 [Diploscapter pachys]|uniref:Uncharacterized protein n=1 Tax=Diploscapter pachys TaxID=2018661 RepID=A0A2A2M2D5_9BILA|nr:hypothetical protein WR25_18257 [Diploscapter pachys]